MIEFIGDGKPKCVGPSRRVLWGTVRGRERHAGWGGRDVMEPGSGRLGWADALPSFPEETIWVGEGYK